MNKAIAGFYSKNKIFLIILAIALILRLVFFFSYHEIWWDSAVYIGMGKYMLSFGSSGLWEHIRPVLWPLFLGFGWKLGFDTVIFGRAATLALSIASIFVFYLITTKLFDKKTSLIASAIFSFSAIFFYLGFHKYTEIPTLFCILVAAYFFIEQRFYFSGLFFGLAFLAKFPAPLFFLAAAIILLLERKFKGAACMSLGFATPIVPFLALNQAFYGNFLFPFTEGSAAIKGVLGCNVFRYKPFYYYFYVTLFDNPLNIFSILGFFQFFRKYDKKKLLPFLFVLLPLIYFSQLHCRDYRYLAMFLPFVIMFTASGISIFVKKKEYLVPVLFAVMLFSSSLAIHFHLANEPPEDTAATGYFKFLQGKNTSLEIWTSNPTITIYTDANINKIYYPIYDRGVSTSFYRYLLDNTGKIGYVFMDNCGGGIICASEDYICEENLNLTFSFLETHFNKVYDEKKGSCRYRVYQK